MPGHGRLDRCVKATANVYLDGRPSGSAVLVDSRHLLTAKHNLGSGKVTVGFDRESDAFPVTVDTPSGDLDLAVLQLPKAIGRAPLALSGSRRPPDKVQVFGFPQQERRAAGVWRRFSVSGPSTVGTVQLDWVNDGTFEGQSGGPVIDEVDGSLVGILVEGSAKGRFDRFLPMERVEQSWPSIRRPWLFAGQDARAHAERRATGRRGLISGGDLFEGRETALTKLDGWLNGVWPGRLLVVTGQPGAGKSAVICRAALAAELTGASGLFFHARQATAAEFLDAVARVLGLSDPEGRIDALLEDALKARGLGRLLVVLDALDEAASGKDRRLIASALAELSRLPWTRIAVATRPMAAADRYAPGHLMSELGVHSSADGHLVDLDEDPYRDQAAVEQFAKVLLAQEGFANPGPPGAAWSYYNKKPAICRLLASILADRAAGNFLVAALTAQPLSEADLPLDPTSDGFTTKDLPSTIGDALNKFLDGLGEHPGLSTRALLVALAYARGDGISDRLWLRFAHALGYRELGQRDIDFLRSSGAVDYLLTTSREPEGRVTRLFHQALIEDLTLDRDRLDDEREVFAALLAEVANQGGWEASPYGYRHAADHAAAASQLDELLDDNWFLCAADMPRLAAVIEAQPDQNRCPAAIVVRRCAHRVLDLTPDERLALFEVTAAHLGMNQLRAKYHASHSKPSPGISWAHSLGAPHRTLPHDSAVRRVAFGTNLDGSLLLYSVVRNMNVWIWQATTGQLLHVLPASSDPAFGAKFGHEHQSPLLVTATGPETVVRWDPYLESDIRVQILNRQSVQATTIRARPGLGNASDGERLATISDDLVARFLDSGTVIVTDQGRDLGWASSSALGSSQEGPLLLAMAGDDTVVRIWNLGSGEFLHELAGHSDFVRHVAFGTTAAGTLILASVGDDMIARVWDPMTGELLRELLGHTEPLRAASFGTAKNGSVLLATAGDDRTVRIWDPSSGELLHELPGHTAQIRATSFGTTTNGTLLLATASADHTVRIWNPIPDGHEKELPGHTHWINAAAFGKTALGTILATASDDYTVRICDPNSGQFTNLLRGHTRSVRTAAFGTSSDGTILATAGDDGIVHIWNPASGELLHEIPGHTDAVYTTAFGLTIDGAQLLATAGTDRAVRIWNCSTFGLLHELPGHTSWVFAAAFGTRRDGLLLLATAGADKSVRIWDVSTPASLRELHGHSSAVRALAFGTTRDGALLLASAGDDKAVRIWNPDTGDLVLELPGHTDWVFGTAFGTNTEGALLLATAGADHTVRIWNPIDGALEHVIHILEEARAITFGGPGELFVGTGRAILRLVLPP